MTSYDVDLLRGVPKAFQLRTIHVLGLVCAVLSLMGALEWPGAWRLVALADLAAMSALFALAAGREWILSRQHSLTLNLSAPMNLSQSLSQ